MLVLTRHEGESIVIDDSILLKVLKVKSKRVRIGIDAPDSVVIRREEIAGRAEAGNSDDQGNDN